MEITAENRLFKVLQWNVLYLSLLKYFVKLFSYLICSFDNFNGLTSEAIPNQVFLCCLNACFCEYEMLLYLELCGGVYNEYTVCFVSHRNAFLAIPNLGSKNVTNEGLSRACYITRLMLSSRYDLRNAFRKMYGRIALIGDGEQFTSLHEYRYNS